MFEDLKKNLEQEKKIVGDMRLVQIDMQNDASNKQLYLSSLSALQHQLMLLNKAVPELLKEESPIKKFVGGSGEEKSVSSGVSSEGEKKKAEPSTVRMSYVSPSTKEKRYITINKDDKKAFLEKLKLSEGSLLSLEKMKTKEIVKDTIHKPSEYVKISNKFFLKYSEKLTPNFDDLSKDLKKANIRFLISTYISMAILSMVLAFATGVLIFGLMMIVNLSNWVYFWIPFIFVALVAFSFYSYPASEAKSIQNKISQELPFVTIHMAAIAGSNIEPTKIFRIIAMSKEYPNVGKEIRKVIVQIEIYGYDLVSSLKNVAGRTSSKKLTELFSGLAANIVGGGELKNYLEKTAENFLLDYKLERQKYTDLAGTFMNIYISILIAAPLILMMMFIVMGATGMGVGGLETTALLGLSIAGIVVANIVFLIVLNLKQLTV